VETDSTVLQLPDQGSGDWTWPPYAPVETRQWSVDGDGWASPTCVRHPWVRLGRWTLLYRRAA
jgi:hypothetical protein